MSTKLSNLNYKAGMPGLIASTGYKHTRQQLLDSVWVNKTLNINFPYGTVICADPLTGELCLPSVANSIYVGILQDPIRIIDQNYYAPKDPVIVCTMGDIWAKIDSGIDIKPLKDKVYYVKAAGATLGYLTNVATDNGQIPDARFISTNANGLVTVALGMASTL